LSQVRIVASLAAALGTVALSLNAASGVSMPSQQKGGTFRTSISVGLFQAIDPALYGNEAPALRPACAALMSYPNKPLPAGLRLTPELAESYPIVSRDRKTYTFTIRSEARFSNGARVTARDLVNSLERMFNPNMRSFKGLDFEDVLGARQMLSGTATRLAGAVAKGRTLRLRLTRPDLTAVCLK
jgi:ABC-type transport system substrate-binding protein